MRIDIPLLSPEEPEHTSLLLGRAHAIPLATTPKTPWKPRISLMAEVNDLLKWGMADDSSHETEHSASEKAAAAEAVMSLSHKVEVPALPINTSSQASLEEGKAPLESNPVNISPTVAAYSSHSGSPMVDLTELRTDASLAADHMLSVKRSTDLKRQQITWELGLQLHQNKAKETVANEKAKGLHLHAVLDAKVDCAKAVLEAKYSYRAAIQEAKLIQGNRLQESEVAYSKALGKNATVRSSRSATLHRAHVRLRQELEEQAIREESKSHHDFLSACQAILLHALQSLKENLTTSYHVLLGQSPSSSLSAPPPRTSPVEEQTSTATSPRPVPKQSPQSERRHALPEPWESMSVDETSPQAMQEGPTSSKRQEAPIWFASLKPSHAEAFSQDSDIVKEARLHFFSKHSCNWANDGTNDLSNVFKGLAENASLLGEAIYEIHLWSIYGPEELKQANYALQSLPKGLRFLRVVPTTESPKVMGLMVIHDPDAL